MISAHEKMYSELNYRERIELLLDEGAFTEISLPDEYSLSPHLNIFDLPAKSGDGVVIGEGFIQGKSVAVISQDGSYMGGAIGEVHSARIVGLLRRSMKTRPDAILFMLDSGGVRLQEANAGEIGVAEIIRAVFDLRAAGIQVIGLVGGGRGCFGGGGIIASCCDSLIGSDVGRIGLTGPALIERVEGKEKFDSSDSSLVQRTVGVRSRYLSGMVAEIVEDKICEYRKAVLGCLKSGSRFDFDKLKNEQQKLEERLDDFGCCEDACSVWKVMGFSDVQRVPDLSLPELKSAVCSLGVRAEDEI